MKPYAPFLITASALALLGQGCSPLGRTSESPATPAPITSPYQSSEPPTSMNPTPSGLAFPGVLPESETKKNVRITTAKGDMVIELLPDQGPNAASNFVYLIGKKYYDGIIFHRREPGFVIQGGDPLGVGTGGPGYQFADDTVKPVGQNPLIKKIPPEVMETLKSRFPPGHPLLTQGVMYAKGTLAMANAGPNTNGSQFFILLEDSPLTPDYSVFGRVTEGMDVVDAIQIGDVMTRVVIE
jgi:cyclophilin family peptidyl-prolyl cis-trans isomerase